MKWKYMFEWAPAGDLEIQKWWAHLDEYGELGWQLVCVYEGRVILKKLKEDNGQEEETTQETYQEDTDQEDTHQPKSSINPGKLYSKAYAHCFKEGSS